MPYVKGKDVIGIEDCDEAYADAGKTHAYVETAQKLSKSF